MESIPASYLQNLEERVRGIIMNEVNKEDQVKEIITLFWDNICSKQRELAGSVKNNARTSKRKASEDIVNRENRIKSLKLNVDDQECRRTRIKNDSDGRVTSGSEGETSDSERLSKSNEDNIRTNIESHSNGSSEVETSGSERLSNSNEDNIESDSDRSVTSGLNVTSNNHDSEIETRLSEVEDYDDNSCPVSEINQSTELTCQSCDWSENDSIETQDVEESNSASKMNQDAVSSYQIYRSIFDIEDYYHDDLKYEMNQRTKSTSVVSGDGIDHVTSDDDHVTSDAEIEENDRTVPTYHNIHRIEHVDHCYYADNEIQLVKNNHLDSESNQSLVSINRSDVSMEDVEFINDDNEIDAIENNDVEFGMSPIRELNMNSDNAINCVKDPISGLFLWFPSEGRVSKYEDILFSLIYVFHCEGHNAPQKTNCIPRRKLLVNIKTPSNKIWKFMNKKVKRKATDSVKLKEAKERILGTLNDEFYSTSKKKYVCQPCGVSSFSDEIMKQHVSTHVGLRVRLLCKVCQLTYSNIITAGRHIKKHASLYACYICDREHVNRNSLNRHFKSHVSQYSCPVVACERNNVKSKLGKPHTL